MRLARLVGAICVWLAPSVGFAAAAETGSDTEMVQRTWYKSLSYQTLSSVDDFAFGYLFGGGVAAGGILVLANAVSELAVNYAHDLTWAVASRDLAVPEEETRTTRTVTYTAVNTVRVFGLGLLVTGNAAASLGYVAFNAVADAAVYAANDAVWARYWPEPEPPRQSHRRSLATALDEYLPSIRVTTRQVAAPGASFIRVMPTAGDSFIRVVPAPVN